MPSASRDRLARPVDISTLYRGAARRVNLIVDEPGLTWTGLSENPTRNVSGGGGNGSSGSNDGAHRAGYIRNRNLRRSGLGGWENRTPARRGGRRGRGSVLPPWHPRTPLRDITAIVRAIERRRARLHLHNDQVVEAPQGENSAPAVPTSANLEHEAFTPMPTITVKPKSSPTTQMWKIMADIPNEISTTSEVLTPRKKLLNSIEKVREVWLEEQQKLESTPAAKRAEREKKVRTLMSMR